MQPKKMPSTLQDFRMPKFQRKWTLYGAGAILVWFLLASCVRTVQAGEIGIITRFGEVNREAHSGISVKLPWPIENMYRMDTRIQKEQQDTTAATADLQDVKATLALNYALNQQDALKVFKDIGMEYNDRVVTPTVQESFKAATAKYTASELLTRRAEVKNEALSAIKKRLEPYGVKIEDLNIVNFSFSPEFARAIEAKQVAAQQAEQAKYNAEKANVDAQADINRARGQAEAQRLIQTTITPDVLQKQAIDKWDGKMPNYMGSGTVFNIPLNR
ncbi:prohibitin family protein [Candidatus Saccharibacteria bacterium]|nr:prohibitin family protein [Candidatus Saccharibacteria bacterium]